MGTTLKLLPLFASLGLFLSACAGPQPVGLAEDIELTTLEKLPANPIQEPYYIRPLQPLQIDVYDSENLSGTFVPDANGRFGFPLIGIVETQGLTLFDVSRAIENRLRGEYILQPQVSVRPEEIKELSISVGGQVEKPGTYSASESQSLLRAINNAGGISDYAKSDDVLILRTVNGQKYIGAYNLVAIQRGNYADPRIFPNDIISVGDSPSKRMIQRLLAFVPLLTTTAIFIDRVGAN